MRLCAELIRSSQQYVNPVGEFYLDLRSLKIKVIENLTATND